MAHSACSHSGRVQSVALRLVAERESEIQAFLPQHYWTVDATLQTAAGGALQVRPNDMAVSLTVKRKACAVAACVCIRDGTKASTGLYSEEQPFALLLL